MHILLTDILRCPKCGPEFGLILLADQISDRQVFSGGLGCPNCRTTYPVLQGVADLRVAAQPPLAVHGAGDDLSEEDKFRVAALLGAQQLNARLLVLETTSRTAPDVATVHTGIHVVSGAARPSPRPGSAVPSSAAAISLALHGSRFPFSDRAFQATAIVGAPSAEVLREVRRVSSPGSRLVIQNPGIDTAKLLHEQEFDLHLEEGRSLVAAVPGPR